MRKGTRKGSWPLKWLKKSLIVMETWKARKVEALLDFQKKKKWRGEGGGVDAVKTPNLKGQPASVISHFFSFLVLYSTAESIISSHYHPSKTEFLLLFFFFFRFQVRERKITLILNKSIFCCCCWGFFVLDKESFQIFRSGQISNLLFIRFEIFRNLRITFY